MKTEVHPQYHTKAKVTCACGQVFTVGSTVPEISVEICSNCHPFYTGKQKLLDSARRVEKFQEKLTKKSEKVTGKKVKKIKRQTTKAKKSVAAEKDEK